MLLVIHTWSEIFDIYDQHVFTNVFNCLYSWSHVWDMYNQHCIRLFILDTYNQHRIHIISTYVQLFQARLQLWHRAQSTSVPCEKPALKVPFFVSQTNPAIKVLWPTESMYSPFSPLQDILCTHTDKLTYTCTILYLAFDVICQLLGAWQVRLTEHNFWDGRIPRIGYSAEGLIHFAVQDSLLRVGTICIL